LVLPARLDELLQRLKAGACSRGIDASGLGLSLAKPAETGRARDAAPVAAVARAQRIRKGALPLRPPHDPVDLIGPRIIFDGPEQPVAVVRIVEAERIGVAAVEALLLSLSDAGHVRAPDVFEPADGLHAALARLGDHGIEHVVIAEIRRAKLFD